MEGISTGNRKGSLFASKSGSTPRMSKGARLGRWDPNPKFNNLKAHRLPSEKTLPILQFFSPQCYTPRSPPWGKMVPSNQVHAIQPMQEQFCLSLARLQAKERVQKICVTWWDLQQHHMPIFWRVTHATDFSWWAVTYFTGIRLSNKPCTIDNGQPFWGQTETFDVRVWGNARWSSCWGYWGRW
jgi:hypothetical protein